MPMRRGEPASANRWRQPTVHPTRRIRRINWITELQLRSRNPSTLSKNLGCYQLLLSVFSFQFTHERRSISLTGMMRFCPANALPRMASTTKRPACRPISSIFCEMTVSGGVSIGAQSKSSMAINEISRPIWKPFSCKARKDPIAIIVFRANTASQQDEPSLS